MNKEEMDKKKFCKFCIYVDMETKVCRRNPPLNQLNPVRNELVACFPEINPDKDWCGHIVIENPRPQGKVAVPRSVIRGR